MVEASYSHRTDSTELVEHRKTLRLHREACEIIDAYPWESELKISEEMGEDGGFYFWIGDPQSRHSSYQFVPMDTNKGWLTLEIIAKQGTLGLFGKKAVSVDFGETTITDVKFKINDLFNHTVDSLYSKHTG